jgi:MarR family transcriptional regulator, organic hydroperoxide resistance regulator
LTREATRSSRQTNGNRTRLQAFFLVLLPNLIKVARMRASGTKGVHPAGAAKKFANSKGAALKNQAAVGRFIWAVTAIGVHLEDLRHFWAKALGISGPQWMILMALADIVENGGAPVNVVSKRLLVDSSFVTTQSKILEKKGFLRRQASEEDGRIVRLSLTEKTCRHLAELAAKQEAVNQFVFGELGDRQLGDLNEKLTVLQNRLAEAALRADSDA